MTFLSFCSLFADECSSVGNPICGRGKTLPVETDSTVAKEEHGSSWCRRITTTRVHANASIDSLYEAILYSTLVIYECAGLNDRKRSFSQTTHIRTSIRSIFPIVFSIMRMNQAHGRKWIDRNGVVFARRLATDTYTVWLADVWNQENRESTGKRLWSGVRRVMYLELYVPGTDTHLLRLSLFCCAKSCAFQHRNYNEDSRYKRERLTMGRRHSIVRDEPSVHTKFYSASHSFPITLLDISDVSLNVKKIMAFNMLLRLSHRTVSWTSSTWFWSLLNVKFHFSLLYLRKDSSEGYREWASCVGNQLCTSFWQIDMV